MAGSYVGGTGRSLGLRSALNLRGPEKWGPRALGAGGPACGTPGDAALRLGTYSRVWSTGLSIPAPHPGAPTRGLCQALGLGRRLCSRPDGWVASQEVQGAGQQLPTLVAQGSGCPHKSSL